MGRSDRFIAAAALLLLAACHRTLPGGVRCSALGGPEWREYRSAHFRLDTDLDRPAAARAVADLERLRGLVMAGLSAERREIPGYVRVVVPAREGTFRELMPSRLVLGFFAIGPLGEPTIWVHPLAFRHDPEIVAHELAHHYTWYFFPRQPLWFAEGVAQFVQTVASDTPGFENAVGVVPRMRARELRETDPVSARELLAWNGDAPNHGRYELWSWILYDWLWVNRPKPLAAFQKRLAAGDDPGAAWLATFPDLDPANASALKKLDAALDAHREGGDLVYYRVSAESEGRFEDAPLSAADVHMLLTEGSELEIPSALADDRLHPTALVRQARAHGTSAAAALRASVAARPGDWRGWFQLGVQLEREGDPAEREAAYRRAVELNPQSALAQNNLAWTIALGGRAAEALPFARRAVELAPADPRVLDTLATVAADLGACDEAVALERRAVAVARRQPRFSDRLREIEKGCGAAKPAGGSGARVPTP